jgi:hypothetical protein
LSSFIEIDYDLPTTNIIHQSSDRIYLVASRVVMLPPAIGSAYKSFTSSFERFFFYVAGFGGIQT